MRQCHLYSALFVWCRCGLALSCPRMRGTLVFPFSFGLPLMPRTSIITSAGVLFSLGTARELIIWVPAYVVNQVYRPPAGSPAIGLAIISQRKNQKMADFGGCAKLATSLTMAELLPAAPTGTGWISFSSDLVERFGQDGGFAFPSLNHPPNEGCRKLFADLHMFAGCH